ncbi:MAG: RluA family pseudouridine synthase [Pseudomonadota bacterium]
MDESSYLMPQDLIPARADKVLAERLDGRPARSRIGRLIKSGAILVNGKRIKPSDMLGPGDLVEVLTEEPEPIAIPTKPAPDFKVLYEDAHIVVVDKPAGLVVHPGAGRETATLVSALLRDRPEMIGVGDSDRWGVVHRLDKDTSGVMVTAKTHLAHERLSAMFKAHDVHRVYMAIVRGNPGKDDGIVDAALGRHPHDRKRISVVTSKPRHAVTRWKVLTRLGELSLLEVTPQTGRTHQIRVHLASIGLPVAGDAVYGRARKKKSASPLRVLGGLSRQALHAAVLGFRHPISEEYLEFRSPLPPDMTAVIEEAERSGFRTGSRSGPVGIERIRTVPKKGALAMTGIEAENQKAFLDAVGLAEEPFGVFYTDEEPVGALSPKPGRLPSAEQEARNEVDFKELFADFSCVVGLLWIARKKRAAVYFDREHFGCIGGAFFLGYLKPQLEFIVHYVSTGIPGVMEGERYLASPQACRKFYEDIDPRPAPKRYCVFKPVSALAPHEKPEVIVFFGRPEAVSGLHQLAVFVTDDIEAVASPFGAGCANMVTWPVKYRDAGKVRAVLGGWDPSERKYLKTDEITFAVPGELYEMMLSRWQESFLTADAWKAVRKRVDKSRKVWGEE